MVRLDGEFLAESLIAIEGTGTLSLPICALAQALSLAISCTDDRAYGFVLQESRPFVLDLEDGYVISGREVFAVNNSAFAQQSDIFVNLPELGKWLPLDLYFENDTSTLKIHPREPLPLQEFNNRQKMRPRALPPERRQLKDFTTPRVLASIPTVDFATQLQLSGEENGTMLGVTQNSLDVSGDLLYMSAEGHFSAKNDLVKRLDLSLYRQDVPGGMAGPLQLTQIRLGSSQVPYIDGIGASSNPMYGIYLSNRPIYGATNFLTHNINGSLPQGWDAELLHNGMPVAYQPPTTDNMYHFQNLRVYYGINNFKVILHGPFGERRESEETFVSDAITPKGEFLYTLSGVWETGITDNATTSSTSSTSSTVPHKESNITFTSDFGMARYLTGATYLMRHTDLHGVERDYAAVGLRTALRNTLLSMDLIGEYYPANAGTGCLFTMKSSSRDLLGLSLEATQRFFSNYDSPQFPTSPDPLVTETTLKGNSSLTADDIRIPFSIELDVDSYRSGEVDETSSWRLSGGWNGWNGAVEADLGYQNSIFVAGGILQVSTKVQDVSVRGQAALSFAPDVYASNINLSADKDLGGGFLFNSTISHDPNNKIYELKAGLSKQFGLIGYSFAGTGNTRGAFNLTAGMRTSLGVDTANYQQVVSSEPLSPYGMIAVSALVAEPGNAAGKPLPAVGFLVNGGRATTIMGTKGWPVIVNLPPDLPVDVTIDLTSLEDPFMVPVEEGCHIIPRAGVVSACRFTLTTGGEIDGMVFVRSGHSGDLPVKDVRVDLVSESFDGGKPYASTRSQDSGYYLFKTVRPGNYKVVIPVADLGRLKAAAVPPIVVTMPIGGDMVSGKDFYLTPAAAESKEAPAPR